MLNTLKQQQEGEVKKNDYCKKELQENEMETMNTEDIRDDLNAKIRSLESQITTLTQDIADAKVAINQAQVDRQPDSNHSGVAQGNGSLGSVLRRR